MAGDLHRYSLRHAIANHVASRAAAQIVEEQAGTVSRERDLVPRRAKVGYCFSSLPASEHGIIGALARTAGRQEIARIAGQGNLSRFTVLAVPQLDYTRKQIHV